jgi:glucose-6-phosphate 1-dehydrogenase
VAVKPPDPQLVVIFGASGDLTKRKLIPAFWHLWSAGLLPNAFAVVGYSRTQFDDATFRRNMRIALKEYAKVEPSDEEWEDFARRLFYLPGEFESEGAMHHLRDRLQELDQQFGTGGGRFYYCATPPSAYASIADSLGEAQLHRDAKILVEKPFGRDLPTARGLNQRLHAVFDESQIYRIDHYLGKETVQNILAFRFANGMFEPIWNRRYVDNVQITVAEQIGLEGRGAFYEPIGAVRDMIQTHVFQVMTFLAMEPPVSFDPDRLRDEKVKVLRAVTPIPPSQVVRGQYRGYRAESDVASDSQTETFAAMRVEIDNWRWAGVPFFLRTGKALARKLSEITLSFRDVPFNVFKGTDATPLGRDHLTIRIQPHEGISLDFNVKKPGPGLDFDRAQLEFTYEESFSGRLLEAYELLIMEAMKGDHTLFLREDEVERAWEVLMPVLNEPRRVAVYEPGSWGPDQAEDLVHPKHWYLAPRHDS